MLDHQVGGDHETLVAPWAFFACLAVSSIVASTGMGCWPIKKKGPPSDEKAAERTDEYRRAASAANQRNTLPMVLAMSNNGSDTGNDDEFVKVEESQIRAAKVKEVALPDVCKDQQAGSAVFDNEAPGRHRKSKKLSRRATKTGKNPLHEAAGIEAVGEVTTMSDNILDRVVRNKGKIDYQYRNLGGFEDLGKVHPKDAYEDIEDGKGNSSSSNQALFDIVMVRLSLINEDYDQTSRYADGQPFGFTHEGLANDGAPTPPGYKGKRLN